LGKGDVVRPSATSCKTLLLTVVMRAIHCVHVPILRIKKLLRIVGIYRRPKGENLFEEELTIAALSAMGNPL